MSTAGDGPTSPPGTNPAERRTVTGLDVFRGVVCLEIVGVHCYFSNLLPVFTEQFGPATNWVVAHLRFGFESFFVISGYFLANSLRPGARSYLSVPSFVCRRLVRLAVPFWVAIVFGLATFQLGAWVRGRAYEPPPVGELWPLFLFVHDLVPVTLPSITYWFMAPLFQYYLLWMTTFWIIRYCYINMRSPSFHNDAVRWMVFLAGLSLLLSVAFVATGCPGRWSLASNVRYLAFGFLVRWGEYSLPARLWLVPGVVAMTLTGAAYGDSRPVAAVVTAALLVHIARGPVLPEVIPLRVFSFVGYSSYSIYLTHTYIIYRCFNIPAQMGLCVSIVGACALLVVAVAASVVCGLIFFYVVERPLVHHARRFTYRATTHDSEART